MAVPSIDGTPVEASESASLASKALPALTTTTSGKVLVFVASNGSTTASVTASGLTFSLRASGTAGSGNIVQEFVADSAGALTAVVITVNATSTYSFVSACAFGVKDTTGYDANGSLPHTGSGTGGATVSTSAGNTLILGGFKYSTIESPTADAAWTLVSSIGFFGVFYKTYTSPQTSLTVPAGGTGASDTISTIGDALAGDGGSAVALTESGWHPTERQTRPSTITIW